MTEDDKIFDYQKNLTKKLDNSNCDFNQEIINEVVLWKVARYAELDDNILRSLNKIKKDEIEINVEKTKDVLRNLLSVKGIRLPMASTILRFKNPNVYQIIDQRVYRVLYGEPLAIKYNKEDNIALYIAYLEKLKEYGIEHSIPFDKLDRWLYKLDKGVNKHVKLK